MKIVKLTTIAVTTAVVALLLLPDDAEAKRQRKQCFLAAGDGTAVTAALARTNAKTAMDGVIAQQKAKGIGKAKFECSTSALVVNNCRASQRACK